MLASGAGGLSILTDAESSALGNDSAQALTLVDGATVDGGSGTVHLDSGGDVTLARVVTNSGLATAITVDAGGAIIDGGGAAGVADVEDEGGGRITLIANDGIGVADSIEGTGGSVVLDNAAGGDIRYTEVGGTLALADAVQREGGNIELISGADVQILASGSGVRILDLSLIHISEPTRPC